MKTTCVLPAALGTVIVLVLGTAPPLYAQQHEHPAAPPGKVHYVRARNGDDPAPSDRTATLRRYLPPSKEWYARPVAAASHDHGTAMRRPVRAPGKSYFVSTRRVEGRAVGSVPQVAHRRVGPPSKGFPRIPPR